MLKSPTCLFPVSMSAVNTYRWETCFTFNNSSMRRDYLSDGLRWSKRRNPCGCRAKRPQDKNRKPRRKLRPLLKTVKYYSF